MPSINETLGKMDSDFKDISIIPHNAKGVIGTLYIKNMTNPTRGVIVIHGMWGTREDLTLFYKRLADQGYCVYAINLPAHGEDMSEFNIALASEYISIAVRNLRLLGMRRVAVIGYSAGSIAAIFAACGYNRRVAGDIYVLFERCGNVFNDIINLEKKYNISNIYDHIKKFVKTKSTRIRSELKDYIEKETSILESYQKQFNENFGKLKTLIREALEQQRFYGQRIDSFVLIGVPYGFQDAVMLPISLLKKPRIAKKIIDFANKSVKKLLTEKNVIDRYTESNREFMFTDFLGDLYIKWLFLKIGDLDKLVSYIDEIKNPRDYLHLINFFSKIELEKYEEKEKAILEQEIALLERHGFREATNLERAINDLKNSPPILSFIRRYKRDIIDSVPKLIVHGAWDQFSRPFIPGKSKKIAEFYNSLGKIEVVKYERMMHLFDTEGIHFASTSLLSYPKMVKDIINFLGQTL